MKYIWIIAFYILSGPALAQDIKISKINDVNLVKFANNSKMIANTQAARDISVRIFLLGNEPGSAGNENGEVTHDFIIAVSEFDEYPKQNLFVISSFYNPSFVEWSDIERSSICAKAEYGPYNDKKTIKFRISIDEIKVEK